MYQEFIANYTDQVEKLFVPVQQLASLSLSNGEKLCALQLGFAQSCVDLGVEQLRALMEVNDPESLQAFFNKQVDVVRNISEKLVVDAQAVADIGSEFNNETQLLARESLNAVVKRAA